METIFAIQQGRRKGYNTKYRGKNALRPILCFIDETREYLIGKFRKGRTVSGKEAADFIKKIQNHLPGCVHRALLRADGEFSNWQNVASCIQVTFDFIIANKRCNPPFDPNSWYRPFKRKNIKNNSCVYLPASWDSECRFVVMHIPKKEVKRPGQAIQCVSLKFRVISIE